jgi:hypothetical protein
LLAVGITTGSDRILKSIGAALVARHESAISCRNGLGDS